MNTIFRHSFLRDLKKVQDRAALTAIRAGIVHIEQAEIGLDGTAERAVGAVL